MTAPRNDPGRFYRTILFCLNLRKSEKRLRGFLTPSSNPGPNLVRTLCCDAVNEARFSRPSPSLAQPRHHELQGSIGYFKLADFSFSEEHDENIPYPTVRDGRDLSKHRKPLLKQLRESRVAALHVTTTHPTIGRRGVVRTCKGQSIHSGRAGAESWRTVRGDHLRLGFCKCHSRRLGRRAHDLLGVHFRRNTMNLEIEIDFGRFGKERF